MCVTKTHTTVYCHHFSHYDYFSHLQKMSSKSKSICPQFFFYIGIGMDHVWTKFELNQTSNMSRRILTVCCKVSFWTETTFCNRTTSDTDWFRSKYHLDSKGYLFCCNFLFWIKGIGWVLPHVDTEEVAALIGVSRRASHLCRTMRVKDLPKKPTRPRKPQLISGEPGGEPGTSQGRDLSSESSSSDDERYESKFPTHGKSGRFAVCLTSFHFSQLTSQPTLFNSIKNDIAAT